MANKPVTDNKIVECPKCKNKTNIANDKCPLCGTSLKELRTTTPPDKPKVHPTKCPACNNPVKKTDNYCEMCGAPVDDTYETINAKYGVSINKHEYNKALFLSNENSMINTLVNEELKKYSGFFGKTLPSIEIRKIIMAVILSVVIFIFNTIYASFHTNMSLMLFIFFFVLVFYLNAITKKNLKTYIAEQIKLRPDEKISYIIASIMSASKSRVTYGICRIAIIAIGLLLSLGLFATPHYIYEKVDGGYNLRYYTYGILTKETKIVIPKTYKNEKVIGIRGDVFKNVTTVEEVEIADSVTEIRGGTFENCRNLKKVKLPTNLIRIGGSAFKNCESLQTIDLPNALTEIGGGAFYNCTSLQSIYLPESIKEIGGEAFYNCYSLKEVIIPPKVTEIRGSTFEECEDLERVVIPEGVTRIGGSAFRSCYQLKDVTIPKTVTEIGSSAFRTTSIENVCVSSNAYINERAFKDTNAKIAYYEDDCVYQEPENYYDKYNSGIVFSDYSNNIINIFKKIIHGDK